MLKLLSGSASVALAGRIAESLDVELTCCDVERFPDGELVVSVGVDVRGDDVYLVQSTGPPVHEHLMEVFLLADACRRAGAVRLTAVVPYLGYARQDRRTAPGEPVSIRVIGELMAASGVDRVLVVDPHNPTVEAIFGIPVQRTTAIGVLVSALADELLDDAVVVAPDLGAVNLAEQYAAELGHPVAIMRKTRVSGEEVEVNEVIGDVRGRIPVIVDDMIATGGTIASAVHALIDTGSVEEVLVAATHGLLLAPERFEGLPLRRLVVSDTVPPPADLPLSMEVVTIAELLGEAIERLHGGRPLHELAAWR